MCINPRREEAYFWRGRQLLAVDLTTLAERVLHEIGPEWLPAGLNPTADGQALCTAIYENFALTGRGPTGRQGYVGYREFCQARPMSRLIEVAVDNGATRLLHEEQRYITHVNCSPTRPNLLTFCHEGPWLEIEQRIWGLDRESGAVWKIRPQGSGEGMGHEYWLADGEWVGYHGVGKEGLVYGATTYDNAQRREAPFPHDSRHFHSRSLELIVGDGRGDFPYLLLWRWREGAFDGPRVLCWHRGSSHVQESHVHPRMSGDGRRVLYTTDAGGYANVCHVDVPDFESLMTPDELEQSPRKPWIPFAWLEEVRARTPGARPRQGRA